MITSFQKSNWLTKSTIFDEIVDIVNKSEKLEDESEAQTRFDVIDRIIKEVLGWSHGQIKVEESIHPGYVDYILSSGDAKIVIEAKKIGASFPSPTKSSCKVTLKLTGSVLGQGEIGKAITQASSYANSLKINMAVVTNGLCWCLFNVNENTNEKSDYANLLFPFSKDGDNKLLYDILSNEAVESLGEKSFSNFAPTLSENRIINEIYDADDRIGRNHIADFIAPALDGALYDSSMLNNTDQLKECFISTEARMKFDNTLNFYLSEWKPNSVGTDIVKIKRDQNAGPLEKMVEFSSVNSYSPPLNLIIGSVGSGKTTYLKYFEKISGNKLLRDNKAIWLYIDFESMGREGNPREFLYQELRKHYVDFSEKIEDVYKEIIEPAYNKEIESLKRGALSPISGNKEKVREKISEFILSEYEKTEPYLDKIFKYLASHKLLVIVMDNSDLYEDSDLETRVFSEGLAFSKRSGCHVIISLREITYLKHKNDSSFDAYEFRKLWLDPPPFKEVLSKRLKYSQKILQDKKAIITTEKGIKVSIPDLGLFFKIVGESILGGEDGNFVRCFEAICNRDIRKSLKLVKNFLTSGHIHADFAITDYVIGESTYKFPFHEIFKGSILGQYKHYREQRAECINIFDSRLGSLNLQLLRLFILNYGIHQNRMHKGKTEIKVSEYIDIFSHLGASSSQIIEVISYLKTEGLIKNTSSECINSLSIIEVNRGAAYYLDYLSETMVYTESCLYDTEIIDIDIWQKIKEITVLIEREKNATKRLKIRRDRMVIFLAYLKNLEKKSIPLLGKDHGNLLIMNDISVAVLRNFEGAIKSSSRLYPE